MSGIDGHPHPKAGQFTSGPKLPHPPEGGSGSGAGGRGTGCPPKLILAAGVIYGLHELLTASGWSA